MWSFGIWLLWKLGGSFIIYFKMIWSSPYKNNLRGQLVYRSPGASKKRRHRINQSELAGMCLLKRFFYQKQNLMSKDIKISKNLIFNQIIPKWDFLEIITCYFFNFDIFSNYQFCSDFQFWHFPQIFIFFQFKGYAILDHMWFPIKMGF